MLDSVSPGLYAIAQAFASERMACCFLPVPVRFIYDCLDLLLCKSGIASQSAIRLKLIVSRRMKFDPVGAVMNLLADGLPRGPRSVNSLIASRQVHFRRTQNTFSRRHQSHRGNLHARPGEIPPVNRLLDIHIGVAAAVAHQVAQGGETRPQILLCVGECEQCPVFACVVDWARKRWPSRLDAIQSKSKHMRVTVDQTG